MRLHTLLVVGFVLGMVGCAEKEPAAPEKADEMESSAPVTTEAPAAEPDVTEMAAEAVENWRNSALMDHMHAHAEQLDELNFALDDGDLEGAATPAYWLSRHKTVAGLPAELQPFVDGLREAASSVEEATDLEAARAGAEQISAQCQGCHSAVGVATQ